MNKCTKKNCPMNAETLNPDCNLKGCPYRTEIRRNRMPNSLITKLSKLRYQGKITDEEYKELIDKLRGHDEAIIAQIMWERDIAIEQLKLLGYGLGEKIEPCEDFISRKMAIEAIEEIQPIDTEYDCTLYDEVDVMYILHSLPSIIPRRKWILCSERLPEELEPVNITWVNHNPESYYTDIKDKPFTATGVYFNGQWYWWSTLCTDTLAESSHNYDDIINDDIEITAWRPLPQPYKAESEE